MSGLAQGKNDIGRESGGIDYSYEHYLKHIIEKNDVDVFVHSWSTEIEDKIKNLFEPKKYIIEKQRDFPTSNQVGGEYAKNEEELGEKILNGEDVSKVVNSYNRPKNLKQQNYSQWYSRMKSIHLKKEYEEENNFKYDYVMMSRFDCLFFTDVIFEDFDKDSFYASLNTDTLVDGAPTKYNTALVYKKTPERITFSNRNYHSDGMIDFWFFSNSENMDKFGELFHSMDRYNQQGTEGIGYIGSERCVVKHLNEIGLGDRIEQVFNRLRDYELARRWYLNSLY